MTEFLVHRMIDVGPALAIQLRVPFDTATGWHPELRDNERLLRAAADRRAVQEAMELARARELAAGRWRATWTEGDPVLEPLHLAS
jgi:hypothetical protein